MRHYAFVTALLAVACSSGTTQASLSQSDTAAIRETMTALTTAATTGHYRELGRFFTEDGVWMAPEQRAVEGRSQVQAWFTFGPVDWQHRILEIAGAGDLAYVRAAYSLKLAVPGRAPLTGNALAVLRRQPDGSWLIARYAFSCDTTC